MKLTRRNLLIGTGTLGLAGLGATSASVASGLKLADLRGSYDASASGLLPGAPDDQSKLLQSVLDQAAAEDKPVFLPPGRYNVSNIVLPARTRLMGVPGSSVLVYAGGGHFLMSENGEHVELTGLVLDGANRTLEPYAAAALRVISASHVVVDNCQIIGSSEIGLQIDRSSGRVERSTISGAAGNCGLFALENKRLAITNNIIADCANAGIMVYRWLQGEDGTIVSGNRIAGIAAQKGGTGQWGNGINIYQAGSVIVSNNHVSDCAFSAIRSNSGDNIQISGNTCLRSGETAIYSEFAFNGALIANNIIDGGARGISIANMDHGGRISVCSGNLIRNIHDKPPYEDANHLFGNGIGAEADAAITGNTIEKTARFGIMLGWGHYLDNVIASSNVIRDTRTGIYVTVVEGTGRATISGNAMSGIGDAGIRGYRWREPATDELVAADISTFPNLSITGNALS